MAAYGTRAPDVVPFKELKTASSATYLHSWDAIVHLMHTRRSQDSVLIRQMQDIRDRYNGDVVVPVPDIATEDTRPPPSPRLIADAIDNLAMRAASSRPTITCPALDPTSVRSQLRAAVRRRALYAAWHRSALHDVILRRAYRHFIGYGTCSFVVTPDAEKGCARIELRDPLTSYPELRTPEFIEEPRNVGFVYGRSPEWVWRNYPEARDLIDNVPTWNTMWDMVEWIDELSIVLGILGPRAPSSHDQLLPYNSRELRRVPNRAGMVPVAVPRRVTLDRVFGAVATIMAQTDLLDRLTDLDIMAAERAIFPDTVVLGKDGRAPQLVGGVWHDGREGEPNFLIDGDVKLLQSAPGPLTHPVIDRLTQSINEHTGLLPAMRGQTPGSLRTGRAIDAITGFSVDPRVQEAQEVMARSLSTVNKSVMAVEKGYWPDKRYTAFTGWAGDPDVVEYTPSVHFDSDENVVNYTFPGTDISQMTVAVGQLIGAGLISKFSARNKHPFIEDAEHEEKRVVIERMTDAALTATLQQAAAGTLPLIDLANMMDRLERGASIVEAITEAQAAAQARQAATPPPPALGQQAAPESQPGLAQPGMGVEPGPPAIRGPTTSQNDFRNLIKTLRAGSSLRGGLGGAQ